MSSFLIGERQEFMTRLYIKGTVRPELKILVIISSSTC